MNKILFRFAAVFLALQLFSSGADAQSLRRTPVVEVVEKCSESVVNISTERVAYLRQQPFWKGYGRAYDEMFETFNDSHRVNAVTLKGIGSGVILREEGVIVTNAHVINMAGKIYVRFNDGISVEGKPFLVNQEVDLAFIKITPPHPLKAVKLADVEAAMTGETVVSIGNPFGFENSVSAGIISGKGRSFPLPGSNHVFQDLIQTDASINPGSSGGALLNLDGELVGVNLAVVQNAQSIGFAVSAQRVREGLEVYDKDPAMVDEFSAPQPQAKPVSVKIPVR